MSKKSRFRGPFDKEHGKDSLPNQFNWKSFLLLTWKMLGLPVKTLAIDVKYLVLNRDNLMRTIQMQLSQKQKTFSIFFAAVSKSILNVQIFE